MPPTSRPGAIALGATVGTHLFNAMPPLHHREPGPALALLRDPRVTVEVIADGVHLHPDVVTGGDRRRRERTGSRVITDAIAAAGRTDGAFRLGAVPVDVVAGVARVHGTSTIAGSTATMDRLFRTVHADAGLAAAVQTTAATPARALGLQRVGVLHAGYDANLVVLDERSGVADVRCAAPGGTRWASDRDGTSGRFGKVPAHQRLPAPSRSASGGHPGPHPSARAAR